MTTMLFLATSWGAIGWVILGAIVFIVLVAALGRAIAAAFPPSPEHMSSFKKPATKSAPVVASRAPASIPALRASNDISPEIMAVIAASIATVLQGQKYKVHNVRLAAMKAPNIEHLMTEWSMEGRRQVYSSHQIDHR
ncbi:MAG: hypothetical protein IKW49_05845 [Opitutales bacterium]|nr:hypothetical protein [Opitutales bacterium]